MSERHVILRAGRGDDYTTDESPILLSLDGGDDPGTQMDHHHLWEGLARLHVQPPQVAVDLYRICAAAYCADLRLPRSAGFDGWTRQIVLHVPVAEPDLWTPHAENFASLLSFLSGDQWTLQFRARVVPIPAVRLRRRDIQDAERQESEPFHAVCLFSGGLDSFIGAADALAAGRNLLLMSHVPEGVSRFVSPAQDNLRNGLAREYRDRRVEHLKVTLNPPPVSALTGKERTQRARSILFLGLGTVTAAAVRPGTPLLVPENGFISLNLPLTTGRLGSLSTRTTHPYAMHLYQQLLAGLGVDVPLALPYMLKTKGEMLARATDPDVVLRLAPLSNSCANPNPYAESTQSHCGHCVPCIIRRAAMAAAGIDHPRNYRIDVRAPGRALTDAEASHIRGFQLAISRRAGGVTATELLAAGALPPSFGSVAEFRSVHDRGLAEVAAFLRGAA